MRLGACTHKGKVRDLNEDAFYVTENDIQLFAVADGMGGHNAGEVASETAIHTIAEYINKNKEMINSKDSILALLKEAVQKANEHVYHKAEKNTGYKGMGTTLTVALLLTKIYLAHVGDSRAYLIEEEKISQITDDHSLVAELLKNGTITEDEAKVHPQRNMITRAIGTDKKVKIDLYSSPVKKGDILVLCTDGLSNLMEDWEIRDKFLKSPSIDLACNELVQLANDRGGVDNITVIAVQI
ncbi:Stp1/IreP family PP2C-type Ser/Thr phosphatase [Anaeromicrobium sediminis]|uniref:protein-serine/threonine phosphatase n=1 Tax=Anaeromicrobium sediminis TaxID=1478221 RepID=A0A267MH26_9FIRM|nr:Stp1/IreP family PP2C-type Ser/Thr phosphatase [Anaeromicrobium sediminis]PAB58869.1 hypothetical protein CCE28_13335 [Anaeromicrobium sediminis]